MIINTIQIGKLEKGTWYNVKSSRNDQTENFTPNCVKLTFQYPFHPTTISGVIEVSGTVNKKWEKVKDMSLEELNNMIKKDAEEAVRKRNENFTKEQNK